jgi:hypothetical protein
MARFAAFDVVLFLLPFAAYALWLVAVRRPVGLPAWETRTIAWLALAGALLTVAVLLIFIHFDTAPPGGVYVPAHMENGRIVEGHLEPAPK